jgi:hypothetical protein
MEGIKLLGLDTTCDVVSNILSRPASTRSGTGQPTSLETLLVELLGDLLLLLPLVALGHDLTINESAHGGSESSMGVVVVGRVPILVPARVSEGHALTEGILGGWQGEREGINLGWVGLLGRLNLGSHLTDDQTGTILKFHN